MAGAGIAPISDVALHAGRWWISEEVGEQPLNSITASKTVCNRLSPEGKRTKGEPNRGRWAGICESVSSRRSVANHAFKIAADAIDGVVRPPQVRADELSWNIPDLPNLTTKDALGHDGHQASGCTLQASSGTIGVLRLN